MPFIALGPWWINPSRQRIPNDMVHLRLAAGDGHLMNTTPERRWYQFSLRTLLLAMALVGIVLGIVTRQLPACAGPVGRRVS